MSNILALGVAEFNSAGVTTALFSSSKAFAGHDVVIVDLGGVARKYETSLDTEDQSILTQAAGVQFAKDTARRREEAMEYLEGGGTVIYWLPSSIGLRSIAKDQSKAEKGTYALEIHLMGSITPELFLAEQGGGSGSNLECRVQGAFRTFFDAVVDMFEYDTYLKTISKSAEKVYFVKGTTRCVGAHIPYGQGHVVLIPRTNFYFDCDPDGEPRGNPWRVYAQATLRLVHDLKTLSVAQKLPAWADEILLPGEEPIREQRARCESSIASLVSNLQEIDQRLKTFSSLKTMLAGYDKPLEVATGECFEMLGCQVQPGPTSKDDLQLSFGRSQAVVEVKGLVKSAREEHSRQLLAWVMGFNSGKGKRPKGILVINAFRATPLQKRVLPAFPDSVIKFAVANGQCLITSAQLLLLALACHGNKAKSRAAMAKIAATSGLFDGPDTIESVGAGSMETPSD